MASQFGENRPRNACLAFIQLSFNYLQGRNDTVARISKKFVDSCPLDKNDLIEFMTVCDNEEESKALFFGRPDCNNSPQSHIVIVYDAGLDESGVFHSAEWHDGDWSSDGIREAWLWFFIWVESFRVF
ncbi:hypothetical protein TNCV_4870261 [Trichonephila clavipes]|nr:hypothetical protein TNCV_4870261 [Trichonephila clavipes]